MKFNLLIILLLLLSSNVFSYVSSNGDEFTIENNKHGAVLISVNNPPEMKLYLGKDCDAFSKEYGTGKWEWANGGFVVEFPNKRFAFGRQEIDVNNGGCRM